MKQFVQIVKQMTTPQLWGKLEATTPLEPGIYVVATPIGNMLDMTLRGLFVLAKSKIIAAEKPATIKKLLSFYGIPVQNKIFKTLRTDTNKRNLAEIVSLATRNPVSLVSEAGTVGISDPGRQVIFEAYKQGIKINVVPGPSAVSAAISVDPFASNAGRFWFWGFMPKSSKKIRKVLRTVVPVAQDTVTSVVFFVSVHTLLKTLEVLCEFSKQLSDFKLRVSVFKELTKLHEAIFSDTACEIYNKFKNQNHLIKGEFVLIISVVQ